MPAKTCWVVSLQGSDWQVIRVRGAGSELLAESSSATSGDGSLKQQIAAALIDSQYRSGQPVLLALGSCDCVAASVAIPSAKHARQRDTMTYLLEPLMPWSAEDVVVDFERHGMQALMVAAQVEPLLEMMTEWEEEGIRVQSIVPRPRLVLDGCLRRRLSQSGRFLLLLGDGSGAELWVMNGTQPLEWQHIPDADESVLMAIQLKLLKESVPVAVACQRLSAETIERLRGVAELQVETLEDDSDGFVNDWPASAARILHGRDTAPLELRREQLLMAANGGAGQTLSDWLVVSVMLLLISVGAAFLLRAEQAHTNREVIVEQQKTVYRDVFPDQKMRQAVRTRLQSELRRLQGLRGEGADVPDSVAATEALCRVLQSFPDDLRYRILDIRIDNGEIFLDGHVREHSHADTIAAELRKLGITVAAPQSFRLPRGAGGVGFRITAELPGTDDEKESS